MIVWRPACRLLHRQLPYNLQWHERRSTSTSRPYISDLLSQNPTSNGITSEKVTVHGFVRSARKQKRVAFAAIGDGSSLQPLQAVLSPEQAEKLSIGAAVTIEGNWMVSKGKEQANELHATNVKILGDNDATTYPIQRKFHTHEFLRSLPHLRPRIPLNSLLLRLRSQTIADLTRFFSEQGFVQTHTPVITSSDCEGAGEVFIVDSKTSILPVPEQSSNDVTSKEPFFREAKYLTVSSQLHLEALAQAVGNVWTLSPTFRAEKSDTARHLSEFYMLEAEMAFVESSHEVMDLVENMIQYLVLSLKKSGIGEELLAAREAHGADLPDPVDAKELSRRWDGLAAGPWPRITYHEACMRLEQSVASGKVTFVEPPRAETGLQTEHERYLADDVGRGGPVFVTDYPESIKPFYMAPSNKSAANLGPVPTVACFDLLMPEVCEVVGGSMREHRLQQLREAMRQKGLLNDDDPGSDAGNTEGAGLDWYLDLRRYGSVPHGGFGLGFDRLLSYLCGISNIRDVVTFPRHYRRCIC